MAAELTVTAWVLASDCTKGAYTASRILDSFQRELLCCGMKRDRTTVEVGR